MGRFGKLSKLDESGRVRRANLRASLGFYCDQPYVHSAEKDFLTPGLLRRVPSWCLASTQLELLITCTTSCIRRSCLLGTSSLSLMIYPFSLLAYFNINAIF